MSCTKIVVYGLSVEASNRLGGATSATLDVPADFSLRLSKDVEKMSNINKISTEGVLGFSLPYTETNNAVFIEYAGPLTLDNTVIYYTVTVTECGHTLFFDRLLIKGRNDADQEWDVEIRRSSNHWIELASKVKISELDYGTFSLTKPDIVDNWDLYAYNGDYTDPNTGQRPYYFPLVDYGGWCDQTEVPQGSAGRFKSVAVEDFRPWLSLPYILKAGFCSFGWTLDGLILETEWFKRLWVYALKQKYYDISEPVAGIIKGRLFTRQQWTNTGLNFLTFDELIQGEVQRYIRQTLIPGTYFAGIENTPGVALKYRFQMNGRFSNDRASAFTASFGVYEMDDDDPPNFTGELLSDELLVVAFTAHETKTVFFDQTITLKPGQRGAIHIAVVPSSGFYIESGLYAEVRPANESLTSGELFSVQDCVSDKTSVLDWLKASMHLFNGRLETDFETRTVTILPDRTSNAFGDNVPGFLLEEDRAEDIAGLIIQNSMQVKQIRPEQKRYYRFQFAQANDAYISSLNPTEPAHSRKVLNGLDLPNETDENANPIIEPTYEGIPAGIASGAGNRNPLPYIPRLWDNTDGNRSFDIGPRLLYAYGVCRQVNPNPIDSTNELTSFFFDVPRNQLNTGLIQDFGYVSQARTWEITPAADPDANIVFGVKETDLFTNFYLGFLQELRGGAEIDLLLNMRMRDYTAYNFRKLFAFRYNGQPLRIPMTGIRDFSPGIDIPTPATFMAAPAITECCNLPCGCQFLTCEYYQDFGQYMRQATLDTLRITSFVADGIEYVTAPVGFGLLNIVNIEGAPFVTNMVDALNSIGVPYFSFSASLRAHTDRGKRFFYLKRLKCVSFRIMIQYDGDDVYEYTDTTQQTKWFGSWEDFGYGADFYGTPIGCYTTTEY